MKQYLSNIEPIDEQGSFKAEGLGLSYSYTQKSGLLLVVDIKNRFVHEVKPPYPDTDDVLEFANYYESLSQIKALHMSRGRTKDVSGLFDEGTVHERDSKLLVNEINKLAGLAQTAARNDIHKLGDKLAQDMHLYGVNITQEGIGNV